MKAKVPFEHSVFRHLNLILEKKSQCSQRPLR